MSIMTFLLLVKTMLFAGLVRFITDAKARHELERIEKIVSTMFLLAAGVSLVSFLAGGIVAFHINKVVTVAPEYTREAMFIAGVLVVSFSLQILLSPFEIGLLVDQRFVLLNAIEVGVVLIRIAVLLVLLLGVSTKVVWVAVANEAAGVAGLVSRFYFSRRLLPELRFNARKIDRSVGKELLSFGWWAFISDAGHRIRTHADPIILNAFATSFDVVCFYLGNMVRQQLDGFILKMSETVVPSLTAMNATDQIERLGRTFLRFNRITVWLYMLAAVPLMVFRKELFALYVGPEFSAAAAVLLILMATDAVGKSFGMVHKLGIAMGRMKFLAVSGLTMQIGNLALTIVLVMVFDMGAVGAALSTAIFSAGVRSVVLMPYALRLARVSVAEWVRRSILPGYLPSFVAGLFALIIREFGTPVVSWGSILLRIAVTCLIYLLIMYFLGFRDEDKQDFNNLVRRLTFKKGKRSRDLREAADDNHE